MGAKQRNFILSFSENGRGVLAQGATPALSDAVAAAEEWLAGVALEELGRSWGFVNYTEQQKAMAVGDVREAMWDAAARGADLRIREVVELARHDPRINCLYPGFGHNFLRFTETFSANVFEIPSIEAVNDIVFRVHYREDEAAAFDGTATEVVRALADWLESR